MLGVQYPQPPKVCYCDISAIVFAPGLLLHQETDSTVLTITANRLRTCNTALQTSIQIRWAAFYSLIFHVLLLLGLLTGDPKCRMSILRNGNVACLCQLFMAMSHVNFRNRPVACHYILKALSHVDRLHVTCQI